MTFPGHPAVCEAITHVLQNPSSDIGAPRGIVHLWSLDTPPPEEGKDALVTASELGCLSRPHACTTRCGIRIVTATAHLSGDFRLPGRNTRWRASIRYTSSALGARGRVIANEHPELSCTLIDLSAHPTDQEIAALARELSGDGSEQQIALRGDQRFVARLVSAHLADAVVLVDATEQPFGAHAVTPGIPDNLVLKTAPRVAPGPGEVEVEIAATGLNFMSCYVSVGDLCRISRRRRAAGHRMLRADHRGGTPRRPVPRCRRRVMAVAFDSLRPRGWRTCGVVRKSPSASRLLQHPRSLSHFLQRLMRSMTWPGSNVESACSSMLRHRWRWTSSGAAGTQRRRRGLFNGWDRREARHTGCDGH